MESLKEGLHSGDRAISSVGTLTGNVTEQVKSLTTSIPFSSLAKEIPKLLSELIMTINAGLHHPALLLPVGTCVGGGTEGLDEASAAAVGGVASRFLDQKKRGAIWNAAAAEMAGICEPLKEILPQLKALPTLMGSVSSLVEKSKNAMKYLEDFKETLAKAKKKVESFLKELFAARESSSSSRDIAGAESPVDKVAYFAKKANGLKAVGKMVHAAAQHLQKGVTFLKDLFRSVEGLLLKMTTIGW